MNLVDFLNTMGFAVSRSEGKRLVAMGIVKVNGVEEPDMSRTLNEGDKISFKGKEYVIRKEKSDLDEKDFS